MTRAHDTNTIWAESEEDEGDLSPIQAAYSELFLWDGANLNHGNEINTTNQTRVNFDFIIIPVEKYNESAAHRAKVLRHQRDAL